MASRIEEQGWVGFIVVTIAYILSGLIGGNVPWNPKSIFSSKKD